MKYQVEDMIYNVVVEKKHNKNTYIRFKEPDIIFVTTGYFVTKGQIKNLLDQNESALIRMHQSQKKKEMRNDNFYYMGKNYDIIIVPTMEEVEIIENKIFTPSKEGLEKWLLKEMKSLATARISYYHAIMEESIPEFRIKIRKMKTRWGVCNKRSMTITLNSELIKYDQVCLEYVIIHELAHFTHFNHSKEFWNLVGKYCPNYKKIRKQLKG